MEPVLTEDELTRLVDAWIAWWVVDKDSPVREANQWAVDEVDEWVYGMSMPERLWEFVRAASEHDMPQRVIAVLAAGPLEDLLANHGPDYMDRVETLARQNPRFNRLLGGVWRNAMTDDVWQRVQAVRNEVW